MVYVQFNPSALNACPPRDTISSDGQVWKSAWKWPRPSIHMKLSSVSTSKAGLRASAR